MTRILLFLFIVYVYMCVLCVRPCGVELSMNQMDYVTLKYFYISDNV